jgi:hypothetical protein
VAVEVGGALALLWLGLWYWRRQQVAAEEAAELRLVAQMEQLAQAERAELDRVMTVMEADAAVAVSAGEVKR